MVVYCFVQGCKTTKYKSKENKSSSSVPMYGFPSNEMLRQKWINALLKNQDNAENPSKYSRICIKHFADEQTEKFGFMGVRLKKNAVPTIFPNVVQQSCIVEALPQDMNEENSPFSSNIEVGENKSEQIITSCKKTIRYPGDLNDTELANMSSDELIKYIKMLKRVSAKKDKVIKRLRIKKPLSENNMKEMFAFFDESVEYLSSLKLEINGKPVIETKSKTGFLGFIIDLKNLKVIFSDYVEKGYMKYILTYKLSQDHLEMFFSCIRAMGGYNNNPNVKQFIASYKRLLHHNEIKSSSQGNCISLDNTSILNVSSRQKSNTNIEKEDEGDEYILSIDDLPLSQNNAANNDAIIYIAGYVERKILDSLKCRVCYNLFNDCEEITSTFIARKNFGFLRYPRKDTYIVVSAAEKVFNLFRISNKLNNLYTFKRLISNTLRNINMSVIFKNFDFHIEFMETINIMENHKLKIIKSILELFFKVKLYYYGKHITLKEHNVFVRHNFTKSILFKGQ